MKVSSDRLYQCVCEDLSDYLSDAPEAGFKSRAACALKDSLLKKYVESGVPSADADLKALQLFLKVNEELLSEPRRAESLRDQHLLGELKVALDRFWYRDPVTPLVEDVRDLYTEGRVGPGSSLGAKSNDFYTKLFDSRLTTTSPTLYDVYSAASKRSSLHSDAEKLRSEMHGTYEVVEHSKLLFVPKRTDISRTICVEPNLNMFFQLGLARLLERRLQQVYAIDLSTQPDFNREMARSGSIDGSYATIDLSSASDSLSIGVLKSILPGGFFSWLMALRTPNTRLPDGRTVQLRMISTMGNGFTFPLETIIFAAVVESAYRVCGITLRRNGKQHGNFAVFGDDIIVDARCAPAVLRLLWLLGFSVNDSKTFVEGPFRESCGADWFLGRPVRGVYIKSLSSMQDRYVAINLLNDWSAQTGISLSRSIQYLLETVKRVLVPPCCGLDAGIHVPLGMAKPSYDKNGSFRFRQYLARPLAIRIKSDGAFSKRWRNRKPNLPGLEMAAVAGYISSNQISLRQRLVRYGLKGCTVPNWEQIQLTRSYRRFSFPQWETAVYLNMYK